MKLHFVTQILIYLNIYINIINCRHKRQISFPEEEQDFCLTPNGKSGVCDVLFRCDQLLSSNNLRLLRESTCGYDNEVPKVCCPLAHEVNEATTKQISIISSTKTTTTTTSAPEEIPSNDEPFREFPNKLPQLPQLPQVCGNTSITQKTRIVGGKPSKPGSWPWMAALFIEESGKFMAQCGGALISDQHIITASHCVVDSGKLLHPNRLKVRLGEHNIAKTTKEDAEVDYTVKKVVSHPEFEASTYKNDIAIIHLSSKVSFSRRIWPICLPFDTQILTSKENVGRSAFVTGWGRESFNGKSSQVLKEADLQIVSNEECAQAFDRAVKIGEQYLCAGTVGSTKDSCQGDSGGPLMQIDPNKRRYYLTGIVSFGRRCATPGFPGVYARVSYFLKWISENT